MSIGEIISAGEKAASVLRILKPIAEQVGSWLDGGPEPDVFASYPSELKSVAALERANYRKRQKDQGGG